MRTDGRADGQTDRQIDMTKLIVASQNFANALKNPHLDIQPVCIYVYMTSIIHTTQQQIRLLGIQILGVKTSVGNKLW